MSAKTKTPTMRERTDSIIEKRLLDEPFTSGDLSARAKISTQDASTHLKRQVAEGKVEDTGERLGGTSSAFPKLYRYPRDMHVSAVVIETVPAQRLEQHEALFDLPGMDRNEDHDDGVEFEDPQSIGGIPNFIRKADEQLARHRMEYTKERIFKDGDKAYGVIIRRII